MLPRRFSFAQRLMVLPALILAGLFFATANVFAQDDDAPMQQGMDAFKGGDYDKAIATYTQLIASNPQNAQAYFRRAYVYMTVSKDDEAIADLTQAIQINPKFAKAYFRRAFVYMIKGKYDLAAVDLDQVIALDPANHKAYLLQANANMMANKYDAAIADLDKLIQLEPGMSQAYTKRCYLLMLKADYDGAIANLNKIIENNPENTVAYNMLAWLLATCPDPAHRDGKKAVENGTIACELTDWKVSAQLDTLAAAYAEAGDFLNAIKLENQAIDSQKNEALLADQKDRLALYQSYRPFHMDKYVPRLQMVIE